MACYTEAQKIIVDESPNLWFASPMEYFFCASSVEGFEPYAANVNNLRSVSVSG